MRNISVLLLLGLLLGNGVAGQADDMPPVFEVTREPLTALESRICFRVDKFLNANRSHMYVFRSPYFYEVRFVEQEIVFFRRRG